MPITPGEAADIAKSHGLSLSDATALRSLADTPHEAAELAAKFKHTPDETDPAKLAELISRDGLF